MGWAPTYEKQRQALDTPSRRSLLTGGEQSGKSEVASQFIVERFFEVRAAKGKPIVMWIGAATYRESWKTFDYVVEKFRKLGLLLRVEGGIRDKQRQIHLKDGSVARTIAMNQVESIGQESPEIITVDEAGKTNWESYQKFRSRQVSGDGLLFMVGTVEQSQGWFPDLYKKWQMDGADGTSYAIDSPSNYHVFGKEGWDNPEVQQLIKVMDADWIAERYMGIPRDPQDLVFGGYFNQELHVREDDYIPGLPVWLAVDPGFTQSVYAILAVQFPPDLPIRVVDEVYMGSSNTALAIEAAKKRPFWQAEEKYAVIDIAAKNAHELPTLQVWDEATGIPMYYNKVLPQYGIDTLRDYLLRDRITGGPQITFHPRVEGIFSEFGMIHSPITGKPTPYKWKLDRNTMAYTQRVPSDRNCHSIKALWYLLIHKGGYRKSSANPESWRTRYY